MREMEASESLEWGGRFYKESLIPSRSFHSPFYWHVTFLFHSHRGTAA